MNISIDDIITKNITTFIQCFEVTTKDDGKFSYMCCADSCHSEYTEKSSAIRHLKKHHKNFYDNIRLGKIGENAPRNDSQNSFQIRVKVNPNDILDACAELIAVHGLPICAVEYPAFKKILSPYVIALKIKGIELSINKRNIKKHIKSRTDGIKKIIKVETKNKMISLMVDIATRYNRSVLGVSISYMHNGQICIRTIGLYVLKASHTAVYIKDLIKQNLLDYGIRLEQVVSVTSDMGKNIAKAITLLDKIYQSQKSSSNEVPSDDEEETDDDENEYYIDPDIFDDEYYNDLLAEVRSEFEGSFDLKQGISCGAHCIHLVVSHAIHNSPETKTIISKSRTLAKKLRTPKLRTKLKSANLNMATIDVTTRWNSIYSMLEHLMKLRSFCDAHVKETLTEMEWNHVDNIISILGPFNKYSKKLQSEKVTLSDLFGYWMFLRIKVSKSSDELSGTLLTQMNKYHDLLMDNTTLIATVYLDPRYQRGLGRKKNLAVKYLADLYEKILKVEAGGDIVGVEANEEINNDGSYDELDEYLNACNSAYNRVRTNGSSEQDNNNMERITEILENFNGKELPITASVLDYWVAKKDTYPELYKLASVMMAIPPTQTTVERVFSALALVLTSHRTRLGDESLENILLLRLNYGLIVKGNLNTDEEVYVEVLQENESNVFE